MTTYLINKENIEQIHAACVAYIEKREYVYNRLTIQTKIVGDMGSKYAMKWWRNDSSKTLAISRDLHKFAEDLNNAKLEFKSSFLLAKNIIECYNKAKECFEAMYVSSVDIEPILCEHSSSTN